MGNNVSSSYRTLVDEHLKRWPKHSPDAAHFQYAHLFNSMNCVSVCSCCRCTATYSECDSPFHSLLEFNIYTIWLLVLAASLPVVTNVNKTLFCYFTYVKMLDNICIYSVVVYQNLILNSISLLLSVVGSLTATVSVCCFSFRIVSFLCVWHANDFENIYESFSLISGASPMVKWISGAYSFWRPKWYDIFGRNTKTLYTR